MGYVLSQKVLRKLSKEARRLIKQTCPRPRSHTGRWMESMRLGSCLPWKAKEVVSGHAWQGKDNSRVLLPSLAFPLLKYWQFLLLLILFGIWQIFLHFFLIYPIHAYFLPTSLQTQAPLLGVWSWSGDGDGQGRDTTTIGRIHTLATASSRPLHI